MPNLDGTGPQGQGTLAGRRRGRCRDTQTTLTEKSQNQTPETADVIYGLGRGVRPRGGGFGFGGGFGYRFSGGNRRGQGRGRGFGNR